MLGYEGDTHIHDKLQKLVTDFEITEVVETGTYHGGTTKRLSTLEGIKRVLTFEISGDYVNIARRNLKDCANVQVMHMDSVKGLRNIKPELHDKMLFWADAHWQDHCPLIDELQAIADAHIKPVIVIHDFKVPERADLGFDSYKGQDFTFSWIELELEAIYGIDGYDYCYNDDGADGAKRGVIYIFPVNAA